MSQDRSLTELAQTLQTRLHQAASLLVYQVVLQDAVGQSWLQLLQTLDRAVSNSGSQVEVLQAYGRWFAALAASGQSFQSHLIERILQADNPFSHQAQRQPYSDLPEVLRSAACHDLSLLQELARSAERNLSEWVQQVCELGQLPLVWQGPEAGSPLPLLESDSWAEATATLADYYRHHGVGLFAEFRALRWQAGSLVGISVPDRVQLGDLVSYEGQKELLIKNTEFLLNGFPALHVLLYGSRGSGKSSLVKALLNAYHDRGLRLIEVTKSELGELPAIVEHLRHLPQKFIIFVDDLSFEEDEAAFKALKVVLEGTLTARPENLVVYATSNRRHLIREFFGDRPRPQNGDEIHAWDTVQEKLSFSDRFGLTLTFEPADQTTYLEIVHHLAHQAGISLTQADLEYRALQWATRHNGRSGRTARQFVDFLRADLALA